MKATQTKPIRSTTGADITEQSLRGSLEKMGIQKNLDDLSYAEKRLLIMVSLTDQLKQSQDDFGRSIESVNNQTKIMNEQWHRLSRAVGQMFMPIIQRVLPYVNAILMVLAEIANLVSSLLGFDLSEYDFFSGMSESAIDLEESLKGVDEQNKKLKTGLRGFDKLNNMITPSASGTSGGIGGGISPEIQNAFNKAFENYNKQLTEVKMKASKIRDSILDWLGFTDGTYKNLKLISILFVGWAGYKIFKMFTNIKAGKGILGLIFGGGAVKNIAKTGTELGKAGAKAGIITTAFKGLSKFLGGGILGTLGAVAISVGAIAGAGYLIYKGFQPAVKQLDLFKGISKDTTKELKPFIKETDELSLILSKLSFSDIVTNKDVKNIKKNLSDVTRIIKNDYMKDIEKTEKQLADMTLYPNLSQEDRRKILDDVTKANKDRIKSIEKAELDIYDIIQRAYEEKRNLTKTEEEEIQKIKDGIVEEGIKTLTKNEEEQRTILTRVKNNAINLKIEEYSEILKEAKKNKDELYKEAKTKYDEEISLANRLRYDLGVIDDEKYQEMITQAETNYSDLKTKADNGYLEIANVIKTRLGESSKYINLENGKVKTKFRVMLDDIKKWWNELWFPKKKLEIEAFIKGNFSGASGLGGGGGGGGRFASGGLPPVGQMFIANERGPELVGQIGGQSFVANQNQMMDLLDKKIGGGSGVNNATFVIQVGDEQVGKVVLNNLQEMAKSNGKPIVIGS